MRRVLVIVFILLTRLTFSYAQESVFILHVAVGDTIDQKEKIDFDLFPELKNADFKYGIIYTCGETKKLKAYTQNDSLIEKQLDSAVIAEYRSNIDKLIEFYAAQNKKDTISASKRKMLLCDSPNNVSAIKITTDNAALERSAYEGRRKQFLRSRALENGLAGEALKNAENAGCYGEIKFKKK